MNVVKGQVVSNVDLSESGVIFVKFPKLGKDPKRVTYTSPYFKANGGGFLGIPEIGDNILAFHNEDPEPGEQKLYYISTIVTEERSGLPDSDKNRKFKAIQPNDVSPYDNGKPVGQRFTNQTGAGLYIQRNFTKSKISNNVTMRAETGDEVNVGHMGVQILNPDGDSIVLTGAEANDVYSARGLYVNTDGPQEFKCLTGDINMRIDQGGDINIENNSFGINGIPPWSGNVRIKSRWRDVTLAALSEIPGTAKVHIVAGASPVGAKIVVSNDGSIDIFSTGVPTPAGSVVPGLPALNIQSTGDINLKANGSINMDAGLGINMNSAGFTNIASQTGTNLNSTAAVTTNAASIVQNGLPLVTTNPTGGDISIVVPVTPLPIPPIPFIPAAPVPLASAPAPNAYNDGYPGESGGGAV